MTKAMDDPNNHSDQELLAMLSEQEDRAIELFFRKYYAYLCNVIFRILPDAGLAEDLAQDVFFEFWKKRESLRIQTSARAYLKRAAVNKTLNYIRDQKMKFSQEEEMTNLVVNRADSQEKMELQELQELIRESIDALPERCRLIFMLSRYEELSYREIASKLGISIKTVENQISKALKHLRENLAPYVGKWPLLAILVQFF